MRAIILAAGIGSRLRPITDKKPKTMVSVSGTPMIGHIIRALTVAGIRKITVCVGYKADVLIQYVQRYHGRDADFTFVNNSTYAGTNNMYSLYLAKEHLVGDVLIMNADLVFDPRIIEDLTRVPGSAVAVDRGRYLDESMKITVSDGRVTGIAKNIAKENAYGCSIDIYKFDDAACRTLLREMIVIVEKEGKLNQWTEVLLDTAFAKGSVYATPLDISGKRWFEIDNMNDLAEAEMLFCEAAKLRAKTIFLLDKDGTLAVGSRALPGAAAFLRTLRDRRVQCVVASNNSSKTAAEHERSLREMFEEAKISVATSLDVAIHELKKKGVRTLFWVANERVGDELSLHFTHDDVTPDACLLTYDTEITYAKLLRLIALVNAGCEYYATHEDMLCPTENGYVPDIGCFIDLVHEATKKNPITTFGKPSRAFMQYVLHRSNAREHEAALIGDRLYTDVAACRGTEVMSVLVLTGETSRADYEESDVTADLVVPSLIELGRVLHED